MAPDDELDRIVITEDDVNSYENTEIVTRLKEAEEITRVEIWSRSQVSVRWNFSYQ